jgi:hypothetical protein
VNNLHSDDKGIHTYIDSAVEIAGQDIKWQIRSVPEVANYTKCCAICQLLQLLLYSEIYGLKNWPLEYYVFHIPQSEKKFWLSLGDFVWALFQQWNMVIESYNVDLTIAENDNTYE